MDPPSASGTCGSSTAPAELRQNSNRMLLLNYLAMTARRRFELGFTGRSSAAPRRPPGGDQEPGSRAGAVRASAGRAARARHRPSRPRQGRGPRPVGTPGRRYRPAGAAGAARRPPARSSSRRRSGNAWCSAAEAAGPAGPCSSGSSSSLPRGLDRHPTGLTFISRTLRNEAMRQVEIDLGAAWAAFEAERSHVRPSSAW
jgi:hypothetical protein